MRKEMKLKDKTEEAGKDKTQLMSITSLLMSHKQKIQINWRRYRIVYGNQPVNRVYLYNEL